MGYLLMCLCNNIQSKQNSSFLFTDLKIEGIFRRSGKFSRQQDLKTLLAKGKGLDFSGNQFSVHDCASVLKNLLSELPEPLLTDAHHPAYCHIAGLLVIVLYGLSLVIFTGLLNFRRRYNPISQVLFF